MDNQNYTTNTQHDPMSVLGMFERLDSAKKVLDKANDIENTIEQLNTLNLYLRRFGTISELTAHLHFIEKKMYMLKECLTIPEAADYLNLSISLVYKLTSKHEFPIYKPNGKTIFSRRDDLNRWINRNKVMSQEEVEEFAVAHMQNLSRAKISHRAYARK